MHISLITLREVDNPSEEMTFKMLYWNDINQDSVQ